MTDLLTLVVEDFEPLLNQTLQVRFAPEVTLDATLAEVTRLNSHFDVPRQPFSFILRTAQKNEYYPQAVFSVVHPVKGELPVFLVPIGPDEKGMRYEAIFT
ncbi:MAG: hypothetical protein SH848_19870 [Saprospiraceae bacterium]|nr:hypothetical protein [Saprospiraceae bacterium]MDZ4706196.1 hypothetical protein [Saprospiraceae bacterium]